jgi:hypothetical protein
MSDGGKGSARRPRLVPKEIADSNWDRIFGKNTKETKLKKTTEKLNKDKK